MERRPLVSVIVPIYNIEAFLSRCVDSILAQTVRDFELILVDDGSPDRCGEICEEYARKDSRVRVVHKENEGQAEARNVGIRQARGTWTALIDGDDFVSPAYLETLLDAAERAGADAAVCGFTETDRSEIPAVPASKADPRIYRGHREIMANFYNRNCLRTVVPWGKIYRREYFEGISYPKIRFYEDEATTYRVFYRCGCTAYVDTPLYYYFRRADSTMGRRFRMKNMVLFDILEETAAFYQAHGESVLRGKALVRYFKMLCLYRNAVEAQTAAEQGEERAESAQVLAAMERLYREKMGEYHMQRYLPFLTAYKWLKKRQTVERRTNHESQ